MQSLLVFVSLIALTLIGPGSGLPEGVTDALPNVPVSLPGQVVDVSAGEFFFKAPDTIPEGLTTFRLRQVGLVVERLAAGAKGRDMVADKGDNTRGVHMLWVVRLGPGKTMADLYKAAQTGERTTGWAKHLGGPSFALPPNTSNATLDLEPGNYVLVCYIGSARADKARYHFLNGMSRPLTVVRSTKPHAPAPRPDVVARITGQGTVQLSRPIATGRRVIRVENTTDKDYEFKFQRMLPGVTGKEFLLQSADTPGLPWGGLGSVPPKAVVTTTIDFEPGDYVLGTWPRIRHPTSQVISVAAFPQRNRGWVLSSRLLRATTHSRRPALSEPGSRAFK